MISGDRRREGQGPQQSRERSKRSVRWTRRSQRRHPPWPKLRAQITIRPKKESTPSQLVATNTKVVLKVSWRVSGVGPCSQMAISGVLGSRVSAPSCIENIARKSPAVSKCFDSAQHHFARACTGRGCSHKCQTHRSVGHGHLKGRRLLLSRNPRNSVVKELKNVIVASLRHGAAQC